MFLPHPIPNNNNNNKRYFPSALIDDLKIEPGEYVISKPDFIAKILHIHKSNEEVLAHLMLFFKGRETALGDLADPREIFAHLQCQVR